MYLRIFGINPYQTDRMSNILVSLAVFCLLNCIFATSMQLLTDIRDRNFDGIMEDLPQSVTAMISLMKVLNVRSNKTRFRRLFEILAKEWKILEARNELPILKKLTHQGYKTATLYRRTLLTFLVIFASLPLFNPVLDIIIPLNETRARNQILRANYLFLDESEHFYAAYLHLSFSSAVIVLIIVAVDSMYILLIHHACGVFAVCGAWVYRATKNSTLMGNVSNYDEDEKIKECVMLHQDILLFHNILSKCQSFYLAQMGMNMLIISATTVEAVMYLTKPDLFTRCVVNLVAQYFHLFMLSLPGQYLLDQSLELGDQIYTSRWYNMPVHVQKVLYTMQIRCNRACILTAGGIYVLKIESFGMVVKACMSYITMFLSMRA